MATWDEVIDAVLDDDEDRMSELPEDMLDAVRDVYNTFYGRSGVDADYGVRATLVNFRGSYSESERTTTRFMKMGDAFERTFDDAEDVATEYLDETYPGLLSGFSSYIDVHGIGVSMINDDQTSTYIYLKEPDKSASDYEAGDEYRQTLYVFSNLD